MVASRLYDLAKSYQEGMFFTIGVSNKHYEKKYDGSKFIDAIQDTKYSILYINGEYTKDDNKKFKASIYEAYQDYLSESVVKGSGYFNLENYEVRKSLPKTFEEFKNVELKKLKKEALQSGEEPKDIASQLEKYKQVATEVYNELVDIHRKLYPQNLIESPYSLTKISSVISTFYDKVEKSELYEGGLAGKLHQKIKNIVAEVDSEKLIEQIKTGLDNLPSDIVTRPAFSALVTEAVSNVLDEKNTPKEKQIRKIALEIFDNIRNESKEVQAIKR
jgi:hypothetical protein